MAGHGFLLSFAKSAWACTFVLRIVLLYELAFSDRHQSVVFSAVAVFIKQKVGTE